MRKILLASFLLFSLPIYIFSATNRKASHNTSSMPAQTKYRPNTVIVKFKGNTTLARENIHSLLRLENPSENLRITASEPLIPKENKLKKTSASDALEGIYFLHYENNETPELVAKKIAQLPGIEYAEPQPLDYLCELPNDEFLNLQYYITKIKADRAWEIAKAENKNIIIAIVDSGTDIEHPDLQASVWRNPAEFADNGIDDDGNGYRDDIYGWNFGLKSNDPRPNNEESFHGTHTAGLACATADNVIGIAGISYNARLLPVNVASETNDRVLLYGYQGIIYAAETGADIISCSWGSEGSSLTGQLVIDHAVELGAVVVAAAGNNNSDAPFFPASYRNVLSVGATDQADLKASFSNYGKTVDVMAPGEFILSCIANGDYGRVSGTSMSCPIAAGAVALVKAAFPDFTGLQAAEQVRVTADDIDPINSGFKSLLGKGRVNALNAVTRSLPSIRLQDFAFLDQNQSGIIERGERVDIFLDLINYLASAEDVTVTLTEDDPFVQVLNPSVLIPVIDTMEIRKVLEPFQIAVADSVPGGHKVEFVVQIQTKGYDDEDRFILTILPRHAESVINNIQTSVTNVGRIGRANTGNELEVDGIGFSYKSSSNLLFEGALMMGVDPLLLSDAARGSRSTGNLDWNNEFAVVDNGNLEINMPGQFADQEIIGVFDDSNAKQPLNLTVKQVSYANKNETDQNFILLKYIVKNSNIESVSGFYFGLFFDWDIDENSAQENTVGYDEFRHLGYVTDNSNGPGIFAGSQLLTAGGINFRAIYNDESNPDNPSWGLYDGFTNSEKWEALSGGLGDTEAGPADVSYVMATGPLDIAAKDSITIGFALLANESLNGLKSDAVAAQNLWNGLFTGLTLVLPPTEYTLEQNYPNPFNEQTMIAYNLPVDVSVEIAVFNLLGQKIRTLLHEKQKIGEYQVQWNGRNDNGKQLPSGNYFYQIKTDNYKAIKKMVYMR